MIFFSEIVHSKFNGILFTKNFKIVLSNFLDDERSQRQYFLKKNSRG